MFRAVMPKQATRPVPPSPASARGAALGLLQGVFGRRLALGEALDSAPGWGALEGRDRAFARLMATTVLRRLGQIDAALACCLERDLSPRAADARNLLRLGAAQLLFLKTPPHAAVDQTVALATGKLAPYRSLANAVLRRLAREGETLLAAQDAARLNLPDWLWESWCAAYGEVTVRAIAAVQAEEPPLDLSVVRDAADWTARLEATLLPTGSLRRAGGAVAELPGFAEGAWWVQDAAAALPARLLGDVRDRTVIDLCAAPGGKTAQLAAAGARVIAVDRSPTRQLRLRDNLARLGLQAESVTAEAESWRPAVPAPFVLLDAPCSSTGTLRRHPEIAWTKGQDDIARLVPVQDRLLDAAAAMLAPGGTLIYCTCSLQPEEGPERIAAVLTRHPFMSRQPIAPDEVGGVAELVTPQGELRTLPSHLAAQGGLDGFYAARLKRAAAP
jgi:16S rRNA (cytosine967-C5)-methyltransferase